MQFNSGKIKLLMDHLIHPEYQIHGHRYCKEKKRNNLTSLIAIHNLMLILENNFHDFIAY